MSTSTILIVIGTVLAAAGTIGRAGRMHEPTVIAGLIFVVLGIAWGLLR